MSSAIVPKSHLAPPCGEYGGQPGASPCAPAQLKWILVAIILGSSLAFMDGSVVNVALPTLQRTFLATSGSIQWVVQGYALFSAALLLLGGAIGDRYGRKRTFLWGVALFGLASAACSVSVTLGQLVASRAVQGIGAALLIPQGLSILSASFPTEQRGRAIGTWSAWTAVFAALGPVAGGWLMQVWSWRLIFLLNLPVIAIIFVLSPRIPESHAAFEGKTPPPLDRLGATLATLSFVAIIYSLSFAPEFGWRSPRVYGLLIVGVALLTAFLRSQSGRAHAMMPLSLFRIPRFLAPNILTLLFYGALSGTLYVIPFYLIQVRHYAPASAGAVFLPMIALMFLFSARIGALIPKVGERLLLCAGAALAGCGFAAFAILDRYQGYALTVLPGVLLLGTGMTLMVAPLTNAVMSSVPPNETGIASAVNNALSRLASLLAVSLLSLLLVHGFTASMDAQLHNSSLPAAAQNQMVANPSRLHETPIPANLTEAQQKGAALLLDRAFLSGFQLVTLTCAGSAWIGSLAVLLLLPKRRPPDN